MGFNRNHIVIHSDYCRYNCHGKEHSRMNKYLVRVEIFKITGFLTSRTITDTYEVEAANETEAEDYVLELYLREGYDEEDLDIETIRE